MAHAQPAPAPEPDASGSSRQPATIRPLELDQRLRAGEPIQLVDVREEGELALARLPHAVLHLPLSRSAEWMESLAERLDRERPVAVLCHAGVRSWHFSCWLIEQHDYPQVWNVQGGIDSWSREVDASVPLY